MFLLTAGLLFIAQFTKIFAAEAWGYEPPIGPSNWTALGYPTCGSTRQSPINIVTSSAYYDKILTYMDISSYSLESTDETITITNSGHSVGIGITYATTPKYTIRNGGLSKTYVLDNIHFHWGSNDEEGSEHQINGQAYPLEAHFVHYRQDLGSVAAGKTQPDGLSVLGFLFTVSTTARNENFDFLIDLLESVRFKGQSVILSSKFTPSSLLPSDYSVFYRYPGSLTTPTCDEAVIWSVFKSTQIIGSDQLARFRELFETTVDETSVIRLEENFRPVQPLNGRIVTTSSTS